MSDSVRPHRWQPNRLPRPWDSPGKNTGVGCHFLLQCMKVKSESEVTRSCPTLRNPMDCSPPGFSVHGIFQARVMEWGAIAFSTLLCYPSLNSSTNARLHSKRLFVLSYTTCCSQLRCWDHHLIISISDLPSDHHSLSLVFGFYPI